MGIESLLVEQSQNQIRFVEDEQVDNISVAKRIAHLLFFLEVLPGVASSKFFRRAHIPPESSPQGMLGL